MLIITYTSTHNHPGPPSLSTTNSSQQPKQFTEEEDSNKEEDQEHIEVNKSTVDSDEGKNEENFHYMQSSICCSESEDKIIDQEDPFKLNIEKRDDRIDLLLEEEPLCYAELKNLTASKSEELDFFDELEELPMSSSSFFHSTRSICSDERIPFLDPSVCHT